MTQHQLYINGKWMEGQGAAFGSIDPASEKLLWQGNSASEDDIKRAVASAREAFFAWPNQSIDQRMHFLEKFTEVLGEEKEAFAEVISQETGKPFWESLTEVTAMINKVQISFNSFEERCREKSGPLADAQSLTRFKPLGVVAVFGPFNLPGHLPNGHIVPSLLAGNTVVYKPSEQTPLSAEHYLKLWEQVELPPGVLNLVQGGRDAGEALSRQKDINGLYFTGSARAGKAIHKQFGGSPECMLALEMGGNNPLVVNEIDDPVAAAVMTIQSAFITAGQRCVCARRLIVVENDKNKNFLKTLIGLTQKIKVGPYTELEEPFMGPLISAQAAENVLHYQEKLLKKGGKPLLKSEALAVGKAFISPGIMDVTDVTERDDEEIFGPFLQVMRVKDFDHAMDEANNTQYGLSAGLLSANSEHYELFRQRIEAGIVNWNRPITGASSDAPFGGIKSSGNFRPSASFAADYCSYPVASIESNHINLPENLPPGISL